MQYYKEPRPPAICYPHIHQLILGFPCLSVTQELSSCDQCLSARPHTFPLRTTSTRTGFPGDPWSWQPLQPHLSPTLAVQTKGRACTPPMQRSVPAAGLWSPQEGAALLQAMMVTQLQRICGALRGVLITPLSLLRYRHTGISYSRHWNNSSSPSGGVLFVLVFLTSQTIHSLTEHRLFQEQQSRVRLNFSVIKKPSFSDFF